MNKKAAFELGFLDELENPQSELRQKLDQTQAAKKLNLLRRMYNYVTGQEKTAFLDEGVLPLLAGGAAGLGTLAIQPNSRLLPILAALLAYEIIKRRKQQELAEIYARIEAQKKPRIPFAS